MSIDIAFKYIRKRCRGYARVNFVDWDLSGSVTSGCDIGIK